SSQNHCRATGRTLRAIGAKCPPGSASGRRCSGRRAHRTRCRQVALNLARGRREGPAVPSRSAVLRGTSLFLAEREAAEALVEAGDLATFLHLTGTTDPGRMDLRVDVEVDRVAFLA